MNYRASIAYLENFKRYGIRLGLERIALLLDRLGNPQNSFRSIHIAGTNGKGSVAAMLSSILTKAGYRTGLYTSPHLVDYTERVRVNEKDISRQKFADAVHEIKKVIDKMADLRLTEFEVLTAAAFLMLAKEKADIVVVEVGLGGRFDATNVITPILSVITNIDRDHMDILGNSVKKIAKEKAGIIKPGVPLVTGEQKLWQMLYKICKEQGSKAIRAKKIKVKYVPLLGEHQAQNTRVVTASVKVLSKLGVKMNDRQIENGLRSTRWPGRLQVISKRPLIILDGAHNIAGARALRDHLKAQKRKFIFIIGMQANKEISGFIKTIKPLAEKFFVVRSSNPYSASQRALAEEIRSAGGTAQVAKSMKIAVNSARRSNYPICVTGSLYLVGDFLRSCAN